MKSPVYEPLSAQDASFVFFEQRATHMHVAALAIFEVGPLRSATGAVDAVRLARYGEAQIATLPHYRQRLAFAPLSGRPVWVDDPHFDLDYHLRHTALPPPGSAEERKRLVGRVLSQPSIAIGRCGRCGSSRASSATASPCSSRCITA